MTLVFQSSPPRADRPPFFLVIPDVMHTSVTRRRIRCVSAQTPQSAPTCGRIVRRHKQRYRDRVGTGEPLHRRNVWALSSPNACPLMDVEPAGSPASSAMELGAPGKEAVCRIWQRTLCSVNGVSTAPRHTGISSCLGWSQPAPDIIGRTGLGQSRGPQMDPSARRADDQYIIPHVAVQRWV